MNATALPATPPDGLAPVYAQYPFEVAYAEGVWLMGAGGERVLDLYAYNVLSHRHAPEITACARAASGVEAEFAFVPHSGPFARGIHVTVQAQLASPLDTEGVLAALREFYARSPFVRVSGTAPRVKDVATTNYAHLSAASNGRTVAVMCAIDNLNKGAAGGAVQWMNRMLGLPETEGL